jgi:hypothetical protein
VSGTILRRLSLVIARWRRRARIALDFIAYEVPRQIRLTRASFRGELRSWSTPQTALERFFVRCFFGVLAFIAIERTPRQLAGELLIETTIVAAVPLGAYLIGLLVGRVS